MAPRRGKKASAIAIADIENDAELVLNSKPTKTGSKKKKIEKDEQNEVNKVEAKTKKATTTTKSAKYTEQIELATNHENVSKKPTAKEDVKSIEQNNVVVREGESVEPANGASEGEKKKSSRGKKKKEEETPKANSKATSKVAAKASSKGSKSKKAEPKPTEEIVEALSSKADKKSIKSKTVKQPTTNDDEINETIERVAATKRGKRGARKASPKNPVQTDEPAKDGVKSAKNDEQLAVDDTVLENKDVDSTKSRKRKAVKVVADKSPAKKTKNIVNYTDSVDVIDGSSESKAAKKRRAGTNSDSTPNQNSGELVTKRKKVDSTKAKLNPTTTDLSQIDFESDKEFTMKIVSWNVAGLRSLIGKGGFEYFEHEKPDIICLQEIKCLEEEVPDAAKLKGYHPYWCSTPGGRGGVAILSKSMPYHVENNIGDEEMDEEGRIITAEYSKFFLCCVYVPNAGRKLVNLDRRLRWNTLFENHVNKLKSKKPVIISGDMNVAHEEIDLTNPKSNRKSAGFSDEERAGMSNLLEQGFIDTFRELYPNQDKAYTFWSYMGNARQKNIGWRLDYSIVSKNLKSKVVDSFMRSKILGSDHCPIILKLKF